jgi:Flp pilus assembly protein CpaB
MSPDIVRRFLIAISWLIPLALGVAVGYQLGTVREVPVAEPASPPPAAVIVLVAKETLKPGTFMGKPEELFVERTYRAGSEPLEAFTHHDQLRGKTLARTILSGAPCRPADLADDGGPCRPVHRRAMTIPLSVEALGGVYLQPADRVDLKVTLRTEEGETKSRTFACDVLILGLARDKGDPRRLLITFGVTPQLAEHLNYLQSQPDRVKVSVVLHPPKPNAEGLD